tara:strand:+ start:1404 stop:4286 length:2883 start_codon:yes stop_codon:yes gene_type:complete
MINNKSYNFLDGPPFINGMMHHGHALVSSIKDTILRHKEREGYDIEYNFGFDEHGIPLEQAVEKEIGDKLDLTDPTNLTLFCNTARDIITKYTVKWIDSFHKLNRKLDLDKQYHTSDVNYMDQLWSNFYKLYQQGLIYQSFKVMPYSPKLGCSLSNFEANSNYATVNDNTVTVAFPLVEKDTNIIISNTFLLAWTTTPWSLVGNMGLGVNPKITYVKVEYLDKFYIVAENLIKDNFKENYQVVDKFTGTFLTVNYSYKPIFNHIKSNYMIHSADYITDSSGTGIVHLAPMFGDDDFKTMKLKDLPNFLDKHLCFLEEFNELSLPTGTFLLDTEIDVIKFLARNGFLFSKKKITHSYPMCWRTDTKLVYYANSAWFLNVTKIKTDLIKNVKTIKWHPHDVAEKRFNNWIENSVDWCLSRNRIWGTPIPIMINIENNEEFMIIKNKEHLEELVGKTVDDLHLDIVRDMRINYDGKTWKLMGDVFDCWYESGMACVVKQKDPNMYEPFDFITESLDQTRGWFYTLNVLSTALYQKPAFKNVKVSGLIMASDGKKMSKRLQNYTDPMMLIDKYNSDILRLYLISSPASKGESFKFNDDNLSKIYKKFTPFENAISMFNSYSVKVDNNHSIENLSSLDGYILEQTLKFKECINKKLQKYDTSNMDQDIIHMIDCICNIYIRLSRDRMNYNLGKNAYNNCFKVLDWVLNTIIDTIYPMMPGYYNKWKSIKLNLNYKNNLEYDEDVKEDFNKIYQLIENVRKLRDNCKMRVTLPMKHLTIYLSDKDRCLVDRLKHYIMNELNIENIILDDINLLPGNFKPIFGKIGRIYKKETKKICGIISKANSVEELNELGINSELFFKEITLKNHDNIRYLNCDTIVLACDITVDNDNIAKESLTLLKKKINNVKKEMGLNWYDNVILKIKRDIILEEYQPYLKKLHLKYQWYNEDKPDYHEFNDWRFVISKGT